MNTVKKLSGLFLFFLLFLSCGIDEYIYLDPVPAGNIRDMGDSYAEVTLPYSSSQSDYFTYYSIYYKIYLSNSSTSMLPEAQYGSINSTLYSDFNAIKPYTNFSEGDTNITPSNVEYTFRNRNYNRIAVAGISIENLLNNTTDGKRMFLDFTGTTDSILELDGVRYPLRRSIDNPSPDASLRNTPEIRSRGSQADVASIANAFECYVSLYIVKVGNDSNFSQIYSFPTHIGIFRLP